MAFNQLVDALRAIGVVHRVDTDGAFIALPEGVKIHDLEKFQSVPRRPRANIAAHDPATFIAYFTRHKSEASVIFADLSAVRVSGCLDHHFPRECEESAGEPANHREHLVTYTAPHSLEWQTWTKTNGILHPQAAFAQFLEDNVVDIREPAGADMIEVARRFEAKQKVEFQSAVRLDSGAREFSYQETIDGSAAKGTIKVPERFKIGIPVFQGGEPWEIEARLRWRISNTQLVIGYELYRHEQVKQAAFAAIVDQISDGTETPVWAGVAG